MIEGFLWGLGFLLALVCAVVLSVAGMLTWTWAYDSWLQRRIERARR